MKKPFNPIYAEEIFIVNLYGTEEEISRFNLLMNDISSMESSAEIVDLMESIKRRNLTKMTSHCCGECDLHSHCAINFIRAQKHKEKLCCSLCKTYEKCRKESSSKPIKETNKTSLPLFF